jgi:glyceraldehyde 3-phosphate dehydrogenase
MSKTVKIAINGFGRIGRAALKVALTRKDAEVVAINDLTDNATLAHLFKYDTMYRIFPGTVEAKPGKIIINGKTIVVTAEKDPSKLPWKELGVDVVLECTGIFRSKDKCQAHIQAGAKKVIISAPADDNTPTFVLGVNDKTYKKQAIINNASCTTNSAAPVMAIVEKYWGVSKAMLTTIHSYTADQNLVDGPHKDLRRARSAAQNIVPTTTGAAKAVAETISQLKGKFDGISVRVPTPVVSLSDFVILLKKNTTIDEVKKIFKKEAKLAGWKGILQVSEAPLVSSDLIGNPNSSIVDLGMTNLVDGNLLKVVAWYDNEWGYSNRLVELAVKIK